MHDKKLRFLQNVQIILDDMSPKLFNLSKFWMNFPSFYGIFNFFSKIYTLFLILTLSARILGDYRLKNT